MSTGTHGRFGPDRARKRASRNGLPAAADPSWLLVATIAAPAAPYLRFSTAPFFAVPFFAVRGLNPVAGCDVWQERTVTDR